MGIVLTLLALLGIAFVLSVLLYPDWFSLGNWGFSLSTKIIAGGSFILAEGILIWSITKLLDSKVFVEWIQFTLGTKYRNIEFTINKFTTFQIEREKNSRKYIPAIFIESIDIKEKLRYFSEPYKFYQKVVDTAKRDFDINFFITTLKQIHFPVETISFSKLRNKKKLDFYCTQAKETLDEYALLRNVVVEEGAGLKEEYLEKIPDAKKHIYHYQYVNLQYHYSFERAVNKAKENLTLLTDNSVLITSRAGRGKTNFVCDFTDNFLLKKKRMCIFFTGRDFNQMSENETIEEAISRIVFSEKEFKFSDILTLIRLDKKYEFLFIVIDGINEQTNRTHFTLSLEQFIQRCKDKKIKVILTCRSEYFEERFDRLRELSGFSILPIEGQRFELPITHQEYLIEQYFQQFDVSLRVDDISGQVRDLFSKDKLMLRFFCEAYEGADNLTFIYDIYRFEVFQKYIQNKDEAIPGLRECLNEIIDYMISNSRFSDIPLQDLSSTSQTVLENAFYENVIVRKDLIIIPDITLGRREVVNFVYDEFREYLLASYLVIVWHDDRSLASSEIGTLVQANFPVAEGLQRYLCSWAIKNQDDDLLELLSQFDLFDNVFIENIFKAPDERISGILIVILRDIFWKNNDNAVEIIQGLIYRCYPDIFVNLNIGFLIEQITNMNDDQYYELIQRGLVHQLSLEKTFLNFICKSIIKAFDENSIIDECKRYILQLLCCFSGIEDSQYSYREDEFGRFPAVTTIELIEEYYSSEEFIATLEETLSTIQVDVVNVSIQKLLDQCRD